MSHAPHVDSHDPFQKRVAVALAIYTVILALANMLTNQTNAQAIITSNNTTSKWNYYQAKSNKENILKSEIEILSRLPQTGEDILGKLRSEIARYEAEKAEVQKEATALEKASEHLQHRGHGYEYAATIVELAIVFGGLALLANAKKVLYASAAIATVSVGLIGYATFLMH